MISIASRRLPYFLSARKSGDQTGVINGVDITWASTSPTTVSRGLAFDGTSCTLIGGSTYRMQAALHGQTWVTAEALYFYEFVNSGTNVAVGNSRSGVLLNVTSSGQSLSPQQVTTTIFTPTVNTDVKLRVTAGASGGNTVTVMNILSWLHIEEI